MPVLSGRVAVTAARGEVSEKRYHITLPSQSAERHRTPEQSELHVNKIDTIAPYALQQKTR